MEAQGFLLRPGRPTIQHQQAASGAPCNACCPCGGISGYSVFMFEFAEAQPRESLQHQISGLFFFILQHRWVPPRHFLRFSVAAKQPAIHAICFSAHASAWVSASSVLRSSSRDGAGGAGRWPVVKNHLLRSPREAIGAGHRSTRYRHQPQQGIAPSGCVLTMLIWFWRIVGHRPRGFAVGRSISVYADAGAQLTTIFLWCARAAVWHSRSPNFKVQRSPFALRFARRCARTRRDDDLLPHRLPVAPPVPVGTINPLVVVVLYFPSAFMPPR